MTEHHLNDEALSAHLDGVSSDARDHLAACSRCRSRLEALDSAKRLVGTALPAVRSSVRSRAVASALEEGLASGRASNRAGQGEPTWKLTVHDTSHGQVAPRWYRRPQMLVGAAAAALVVAFAVSLPLAIARSGSPAARSASAERRALGASTTHGVASASSPGPASRGTPSAPEAQPSAAGAAPAAPAGTAAGSSAAGAGSSQEQEAISVPDFGRLASTAQLLSKLSDYERSLSARYSTSSPSSPGSASRFSFLPETVTPTLSQCVGSIRSATGAGEYGPGLVAVASYRQRTSYVDAYVMEFWPTSTASGKSLVAVVSQSGCHLLAQAST